MSAHPAVDIAAAADHLARCRREGRIVGPLPETMRPGDLATAYAIQDALHAARAAAGDDRLVGYKIGCTTPVMQRYLGLDTPCAGGLYAGGVLPSGATLERASYRRPGLECEIAVRLAHTPPAGGALEDIAAAVEWIAPAIEIVDDRYQDFHTMEAATLIADDYFAAGCILGAPCRDWRARDLPALLGRMRVNGVVVGEGRGADILGHPLSALAWLAAMRAARGRPLAPGMTVLLGSLVKTVWLDGPASVTIAIDGIGEAGARFR